MMKCIYQIRNIKNNKFYLGSTVNYKNRCKNHITSLNKGTHHSKHLQNAWNIYGRDNFVFEVIEIIEADIKNREQYYLDTLQPWKYGYNISRSARGWELGQKHTQATKEKIRKKSLGRKHTQEIKDFISKLNTGRKHTEETKKKWIGRKNPMQGKRFENNPNSIRVEQYSIDMKFIAEWSCAREAEEKLNIHSTAITACCRNKPKRKTAGGFVWKYK